MPWLVLLRSGILRERGRVEASRRFNGRLPCGSAEADGKYTDEQGHHKCAGAPHGMNGSKTARRRHDSLHHSPPDMRPRRFAIDSGAATWLRLRHVHGGA
jgi:hypothetical protein